MSSIACFYVLPVERRVALLEVHANANRHAERRVLFFKARRFVGTDHLWKFLDAEAIAKIEPQFSGYYLIDYLFTHHGLSPKDYFESLGDHYFLLTATGSASLASFLHHHPIDEDALMRFRKAQGEELSGWDRDADVDTFEELHQILNRWCELVDESSFGVLLLTG